MEKQLLDDFLHDERIMPRVKVEQLLLTYLGLRECSQITIPAEFPGGVEMGQRIDEHVKPHMMKLQGIKDPRGKALAINAIKSLLEKQFEEVVEESEPYKALYLWSDRLGLKSEQTKVRPTVHEVYLFKDGGSRKELRKLQKEREKLRVKTQRRPDPNLGGIQFAYPEEFNAKWIKRMGKLLGYPDCCISRYANDRVKGINVEVRAAKQLADVIKAEEKVDPHVYPIGYFYPCKTDCEKAINKGSTWHELLQKEDERLGAMYGEMINVNVIMVLRQPELINRYVSQFRRPES
ncbi:MAG: DUF483 domain-containing protein [Candidatus Bathyarchaeota archaeon]|nr:DUF483 domain-containing protein [Candidatus Bathyarchaeota archaeon]